MANIFDVALSGLIAVFVIVVIYMTGVQITGGAIKPMIDDMNPNNTVGISGAQYTNASDDLWRCLKWTFYAIFGSLFLLIALKALYERESTSVYNDRGGF